MTRELLAEIAQCLVDCEEPEMVAELSQKALEQGEEPLAIINEGLVPGMESVGQKFQTGEYFLPHMVIAADAMQTAMGLLQPELLERQQTVEVPGVFVIGSVQGDIHEIGKSLIATMMLANGFHVYDLGVDVAPTTFVEKVKETAANLVGLSALLTTTMGAQRDVLEALQEAGIRERVKVMVGGAPVTQEWAESIGADGYAEDVVSAVQLAKQLTS